MFSCCNDWHTASIIEKLVIMFQSSNCSCSCILRYAMPTKQDFLTVKIIINLLSCSNILDSYFLIPIPPERICRCNHLLVCFIFILQNLCGKYLQTSLWSHDQCKYLVSQIMWSNAWNLLCCSLLIDHAMKSIRNLSLCVGPCSSLNAITFTDNVQAWHIHLLMSPTAAWDHQLFPKWVASWKKLS